MIQGFQNEYRWLSNFWLSPFVYRGYRWPTVEHCYVAHKSEEEYFDEVAQDVMDMTAGQAKRHGKNIIMREDFDQIKLYFMHILTGLKYSQNPALAELLKATNLEYIEETNDTYWGVCNGKGENHLGKIIMNIRTTL